MTPNLTSLLRKANLPVEVVQKPSEVNPRLRDAGDRGAFLMDIRRDKRETLVVRPGRADVHVLNVDPDHRQAVLFVHEPAGRVSFVRWDPSKGKRVTVTQHVPESRRHLLVGLDERHLFVASLPKAVSTVRTAHETLAPESVRHTGALRQGEWFFTKVADADTLESVDRTVRGEGTLKRTPLGAHLGPRRGRPHIADERVLVLRNRALRAYDEFARGVVRHPDHRPRKLDGWHLVTSNAEPRQTGPAIQGMTWVD